MFRTDFPYVTGKLGQFTIIRGKQGRARKRERENVRTCGSQILGQMKTRMRNGVRPCVAVAWNSTVEDGDEELVNADFDAGTSLRSLPSVHHRIRFEYPRIPNPNCGNGAALSGHQGIYRIHRDSSAEFDGWTVFARLFHLKRIRSQQSLFIQVRLVVRLFESWEEFLRLVVREME